VRFKPWYGVGGKGVSPVGVRWSGSVPSHEGGG